MALKDKFIVRLTPEQRQELEKLVATGRRSAAMLTRARILLKADADGDGWADDRIAEALDTSACNRPRPGARHSASGLARCVLFRNMKACRWRSLKN